ncbi:Ovule protein [Caenorhabditis elegans]|uniref:Ovule protein n=1 Tax=Caenorhabditis elegans TaxID=6239 RepID=A3QMB2_CAEEL|nr:Ovule protein [Caenorhabditis elegans]CAM36344.1 Ovule protein [Caenorhabditis elegans]|eukprot:NP_502331.1 Uncharacterized protein CELE_C42C1.3 [Caenorhabditis elegans]
MQRFVFGGKLWKFNETFGCYDDYPHVAPFLAVEHFASFPVHPPTFIFSNAAVSNILSMEEIKSVLIRLDELISSNNLHNHPCLISQAGAQATMRLASKDQLRSDWNTSVEIPFCLYVTQNGVCPRQFDYEDLHKQSQWVALFEEVILPLDKMQGSKLSKIAPHQHSSVVKNAIMKSKREKKTSCKKHSKSISGIDSSSSGCNSL